MAIDWTRLTPAVERAAGIASRNFPAHHNIEDVQQELWVWVMQRQGFILDRLKREGGLVHITHLMVKEANEYLKKEDANSYGYQQEDRFDYSLDLIKSILEVVFRHEDWQSFAVAMDAMPRGKSEPATSGNNLASYADVSRAVAQLPDDQYNALVWRYKYSLTYERVGSEMGITKEGARQVLNKALNAMQKYLGESSLSDVRHPEQVPVRPSKASVVARIEHDYEG